MIFIKSYQKKFEKLVAPGHKKRVKTYVGSIAGLVDATKPLLKEIYKQAGGLYHKFEGTGLAETFLENIGSILKLTGQTGDMPRIDIVISKIAEKSVPIAKYTLASAEREIRKKAGQGYAPVDGLLKHLTSMDLYTALERHKYDKLPESMYLDTLAGPSHRGG